MLVVGNPVGWFSIISETNIPTNNRSQDISNDVLIFVSHTDLGNHVLPNVEFGEERDAR